MPRYTFDIETDGLLPELTQVHCIVLKDCDSGEVLSFGPGSINGALAFLAKADTIWGHNIIRFDMPALKKIYPLWSTKARIRDTMVAAQLIWPIDVLTAKDLALVKRGRLHPRYVKRYSLEAWGRRIGEYKDWKPESWAEWTEEMQDYCEQDVEVTDKLRGIIETKKYSETAMQLEHDVAAILFVQEETGVCFDEKKAGALYGELVGLRSEIEKELQQVFQPWVRPGVLFTPARDNKTVGYVKGCEMQKFEIVCFNPASRDHIADRLMKLHGWKPESYTEDGSVMVDEAVLKGLKYPEVPLLLRYLLVEKRIGQLAEGKEALMKRCTNGRIHGRVNALGAVTRRASHSKPNLAQVPKVKKNKAGEVLKGEAGLWGYEFRDLFYAPDGYVMVGVDVSGLELRMLAHYLAAWDDGAYGRAVIEGDVHQYTADLAGIIREAAKTLIYALLYGAGDTKLGKIVGKGSKEGKRLRAALLNLPGLATLISLCKKKHTHIGHLRGLDGGLLYTRSEHAALNTLLQGGGAIVCKMWLAIFHAVLKETGFDAHVRQVLWVHDEIQLYVTPQNAEMVGLLAVKSITAAGERLGMRVPLTGEFKIGRTWAETH